MIVPLDSQYAVLHTQSYASLTHSGRTWGTEVRAESEGWWEQQLAYCHSNMYRFIHSERTFVHYVALVKGMPVKKLSSRVDRLTNSRSFTTRNDGILQSFSFKWGENYPHSLSLYVCISIFVRWIKVNRCAWWTGGVKWNLDLCPKQLNLSGKNQLWQFMNVPNQTWLKNLLRITYLGNRVCGLVVILFIFYFSTHRDSVLSVAVLYLNYLEEQGYKVTKSNINVMDWETRWTFTLQK